MRTAGYTRCQTLSDLITTVSVEKWGAEGPGCGTATEYLLSMGEVLGPTPARQNKVEGNNIYIYLLI